MPNPLKPEKAKAIEVIYVKRTRRFIRIHYKKGDDDFRVRHNDNPLVGFTKALDALPRLVCTICEVPSGWETNLRIMGITIGNLRDAKTVSVHAQKTVSLSGAVLEFSTPAALLSTPATEGATTVPLNAKQAGLIDDVIEEAKRYIKGDRAQGTLALDGDDDEDGEDDDDFGPDSPQGVLIDVPRTKKTK